MATMWRRAMHYLGLGPDDEYEDDTAYGGVDPRPGPPQPPGPPRAPVARTARPPAQRPGVPSMAAPREDDKFGAATDRPRPAPTSAPPVEGAAVRRLAPKASGGNGDEGGTSVRQVSMTAKPAVFAPASFNEAKELGDRFKANQPVILNLQDVDKDLARRLIDFSSGLCYGLGGQMEKVAAHVYLISPNDVEVSAEERRRLQERGLHDA